MTCKHLTFIVFVVINIPVSNFVTICDQCYSSVANISVPRQCLTDLMFVSFSTFYIILLECNISIESRKCISGQFGVCMRHKFVSEVCSKVHHRVVIVSRCVF